MTNANIAAATSGLTQAEKALQREIDQLPPFSNKAAELQKAFSHVRDAQAIIEREA